MSALFPRWANTAFPLVLVLLVLVAVAAVVGPMLFVRTPYNTYQLVPIDQPVEFDHRHHVADDGIECVYCHTSVETSARAGLPSSDTCMGCHGQIWNDSPLLALVRRSYFTGTPIPWRRVHRLGDFVYFNHAVHINRGLACATCHGPVEDMPAVYRAGRLTMGWCLQCHASPEAYLAGEKSMIETTTTFGATLEGFEVLDLGHPRTMLTTCTACHR